MYGKGGCQNHYDNQQKQEHTPGQNHRLSQKGYSSDLSNNSHIKFGTNINRKMMIIIICRSILRVAGNEWWVDKEEHIQHLCKLRYDQFDWK